jgi:DNA-binding transcriptional regulator YhcF (GntR family)
MSQQSPALSKSEQIIAFVTEAIRSGELVPGQSIPSINNTAQKFEVARKTVVRAYEKLKTTGLIESRPKTGFFVINDRPRQKQKVLLIIHSFNGHWETLYSSFRQQVNDVCEIDIYFHHYNIKVLELLVTRHVADYDLFIISSFNHPQIKSVVGRIPAYKVLLVSRKDRLDDSYNYIIQDFYTGTYQALSQAHERLKKYSKIHLSFPWKEGHSETLKKGFEKFCQSHGMEHTTVSSLQEMEIRKGEAYLCISDKDLIHLLKVCRQHKWQLGKDVGVLSYNETPLKQIIRDGISVISCDFLQMAEHMAGFIKERTKAKEIIPIEFIERNSL